jgi:hypothetical protein
MQTESLDGSAGEVFCEHPVDHTPQPANSTYISFTSPTGATQAVCDAAQVISTCDPVAGQFLPAPATYPTCSVVDPGGPFTCDLPHDKSVHSIPSLTKPAYLQTVTDPVFGTKITRVSGDPGSSIATGGTWGSDVHHQYSKMQAWNADQSLIFIETNREGGSGSVFLDGETYQPVFSRDCPGTECRWHPTDANMMIYASGNKIGRWNPRTNTTSAIATLSGYSDLQFGPWEGNLSLDGSMIVMNGTDSGGKEVVFAYNISDKVKYSDIPVSSYGNTLDWASISPKGDYVVLQVDDDVTYILDLSGKLVVKFQPGHPSHYDMTVDENGEEVAVGKAVNGNPYDGLVIKVRLKDGSMSPLTTGGYGRHTSTRDTRSKVWAVSSMESVSNYPPYNAEIVLSNVDGSIVYRLAHHRSRYTDYESEVIPTISPDGKHVLFASNWGASSGRPVGVYVIDLTEKCH